MDFQALSADSNPRFLYWRTQPNAGTIIIENTNVQNIPNTSVRPTVRIGLIGTKNGHARTLKPTIVVNADSKIAFPVVITASTVAPRYISPSHASTGSAATPSRSFRHASSAASSKR